MPCRPAAAPCPRRRWPGLLLLAAVTAAALGTAACGKKGASKGDSIDDGPGPGSLPVPGETKLADITGSTCKAFAKPPDLGNGAKLTKVYGGLSSTIPVSMVQIPGDPNRWIMAELTGRITMFPAKDNANDSQREVLVDLSPQVYLENEAGFLSFTLDPGFATNRTAYACYTAGASASSFTIRVVRLVADADLHFRSPPQDVLVLPGFVNYHLGGNIAFGLDGMLYIGTGFNGTDGSNDADGRAQSLADLHGKFLRIDVRTPDANAGTAYTIPSDNPFVGTAGARGEIFALGMRNPWRWSIDASTGLIWAGDVGKARREEVDIIRAGNNYGWPVREGDVCNTGAAGTSGSCTVTNQADPIYAYTHSDGSCITGGFVYRGRALPALSGKYIYSDCTAGKVWSLAYAPGNTPQVTLLATAPSGATALAQDNAGELYVMGRDSLVYRLDPIPAGSVDTTPTLLSQTGCVRPDDPWTPVDHTVAYELNAPFWSDGADKGRWAALPLNGTLSVSSTETLTAPIGSVYIKRFARRDMPVETRLFMRFADGSWGGFSYQWDATKKDGVLVPPAGAVVPLADGSAWRYPSRTECITCHSPAAGYSLGPQLGQLNRDVALADGSTANQLATMASLGLIAGRTSIDPSKTTRFVSPSDTGSPLEARAATYLHVNCSPCHRPGGMGLGLADFRRDAVPRAFGVCNVDANYGTFGANGGKVLVPGNPAASIMSIRMRKVDAARMPSISSDIVDTDGTALIDAWISAQKSCPAP